MDLPKNVSVVKLGDSYNKPLVFNKHLRSLTFGSDYNMKLLLPKHLTHLILGYRYNIPIILNKYIRSISFGMHHKHKCTLDFLPNKITIETSIGTLGYKYDKMIDELPNNVTTLWNTIPIVQFNNIPNSTNYLHTRAHAHVCE